MLFLARMDVNFPVDMDPETMADYQAQEKAYSGNLQEKGLMKAIWRVVGEYANYSIYDVEDHDELQAIMAGFPMFKYMDVKLTPLAKHPNALEYYLRG